MTEDESLPVSDETALLLTKGWMPQQNPFSAAWQELVRSGRPLLMELACYEDSFLGAEVESRFGKGSVVRGGLFNGCDLSTEQGVAMAKRLVTHHRPVHLWASCPCGPFCPLQRLNQGTEAKRRALQAKQEQAVMVYQGAQKVARHAQKLGTQIHWEFSEKCEAWKLPVITEFVAEQKLEKVTCHGCAVGLKTFDRKFPLCKGWTIATKNKAILRHMHLICQRNHRHGECRGKNATASERYTPTFARKIVDCFCEQEVWPKLFKTFKDLQNPLTTSSKHRSTKMPQPPQTQTNNRKQTQNSSGSKQRFEGR